MPIFTFVAQLRLKHKFLLLAALAVAMAIPSTWLYLRESGKALQGYADERDGLPVVSKILTGIQLTQQHRGLSGMLLNGGDTELQRRAKQVQIQSAYREVDQAMEAVGNQLLREDWQAIQRDWEAVRLGVEQRQLTAAASFAQHSALLARLMRLDENVGDLYGLSLDPDKDTYYLIQSMYYQLPALTEELGKLRAQGATLLAKQAASAGERQAVSMLVGRAEDRLEQTRRALEKAASGPADVGRELAPLMQNASAAVSAMTRQALDEVVHPDVLTASPDHFFSAATQAIDSLYQLNASSRTLLEHSIDEKIAAFYHTRLLLLLSLTALVVLAGAAAWLVVRSVTLPLAIAVEAAQRVASGNLVNNFEVGADNEIGWLMRALRDMNGGLGRMVGEVRSSVDTIGAATRDIAHGNADLSSRIESQASSLEETASSMEQLTAAVRHNLDNANVANNLVKQASMMAEQGSGVVAEVVHTMSEIDASARQIVDIIAVIDGIAFQTNILALNAAVEAARAGEQGRGFAVVASEVRTLAQRSAAAAKEIKSLITLSVDKVSKGNALAGDAGNAMEEILQSVRNVYHLMQQIAQASAEQSAGIDQVNTAVTQMDDVTQHNAALVEQTAAASASLQEQTQSLVKTMSAFKLG